MIHTHYHGLHIPEARIGAYIYMLYRPAFGLNQGGVLIFRGDDNPDPLYMDYMDYEMTMPWPTIEGNTITSDNGLALDFEEPGKRVRLTYSSPDGETRFDVVAEALTPLFARGHIIPGEDEEIDPSKQPGGTEQMMHVTGELVLRGERFEVDCFNPRDRSWGQVRTESRHRRAKLRTLPPVGWTPMYFGDDLIFNSAGFVSPGSHPNWEGLYEIPEGLPNHYFAWMMVDGEDRPVTRVYREVTESHPVLHSAQRQRVEVEVEGGQTLAFEGETIAMTNAVAWPNAAIRVGVSRWEDERGRVTHNTYQEMWFDDVYQRAMRGGAGTR